jgi:hypothetical protein
MEKVSSALMKLASGRRCAVTYDVVLTHKESSAKTKFRIYGRPIPNTGEFITLPVHGQTIRARVDRITWASPAVLKKAQNVQSVSVTEV